MPRTLHILGFEESGAVKLVSGPQVSVEETRKLIGELKTSGKLPKGCIRLEVFDSDRGRVTNILPHDAGAAHRAELEAIEKAKPAKTETKTPGNKLTPI